MSDAYVECLIKAKQPGLAKFGKVFLIVLTVFFGIGALVSVWSGLIALACGVGAYMLTLFSDLEFEYLYLDKELVIDKVMAKSRRKRVGTYSLDRIQIMAPFNSYQLDSYKGRKVKVLDYSIREVEKPDLRYAIYFEGDLKIIISPSEELIKVMHNAAPRKVFTD